MTKIVYRDYRPGKRGQFTTEETFNRSQGQGVECHVHKEKVKTESDDEVTIDDLFDYEDVPEEDLIVEEYHGSGGYEE